VATPTVPFGAKEPSLGPPNAPNATSAGDLSLVSEKVYEDNNAALALLTKQATATIKPKNLTT
jgi:hypothetical protein